MSGLVVSGLLLLLNLLGMMVLMMSSNRHREKFQHKLPLLFYSKPNPLLRRQWLRWLGLLLLTIAFLLTYVSNQTGYFVVVWFASLTIAAGLVYLAVMIYEQR